MALPDDLLEQAMHLARRDPRRPKQANLRRAVSSAYYALFHLLTADTSRNWKHARHRPLFKRSIDHGRMKQASERAAGAMKKELTSKTPQAAAAHLLTVATSFVELQQLRHIADYDAKKWLRSETLSVIHSAEKAFQSWAAIRDLNLAQDYLLSLFVKDR